MTRPLIITQLLSSFLLTRRLLTRRLLTRVVAQVIPMVVVVPVPARHRRGIQLILVIIFLQMGPEILHNIKYMVRWLLFMFY